jgi:hydrogenase/urease accessory protein HupE
MNPARRTTSALAEHRARSLHDGGFAIALLLSLTLVAHAHDPGLSTATVTVGDEQINVLLGFARPDAAFLLPATANPADLETPEGFQAKGPELESVAAGELNLYLGGKRMLPVQSTAHLKDSTNVEILLQFRRTDATQLRLVSTFLERFALGHREFLSIQTVAGESLGKAMLSAKKDQFNLNLPVVSGSSASWRGSPPFLQFLKLGIEHILSGYDHLLFLFGLMVVCRGMRSLLKVITCFTLAHSITLALAAFEVVRLPGRIVEPLIAASIAYVGLENLVRGDSPKGRGLIAFSFGLVHGLGFADALQGLGLNSGPFGIVVPLVGFNLGVEAGQLSVATLVLPILWKLRAHPSFVHRWVPACSAAVAVAGSYWMVERILQK